MQEVRYVHDGRDYSYHELRDKLQRSPHHRLTTAIIWGTATLLVIAALVFLAVALKK